MAKSIPISLYFSPDVEAKTQDVPYPAYVANDDHLEQVYKAGVEAGVQAAVQLMYSNS